MAAREPLEKLLSDVYGALLVPADTKDPSVRACMLEVLSIAMGATNLWDDTLAPSWLRRRVWAWLLPLDPQVSPLALGIATGLSLRCPLALALLSEGLKTLLSTMDRVSGGDGASGGANASGGAYASASPPCTPVRVAVYQSLLGMAFGKHHETLAPYAVRALVRETDASCTNTGLWYIQDLVARGAGRTVYPGMAALLGAVETTWARRKRGVSFGGWDTVREKFFTVCELMVGDPEGVPVLRGLLIVPRLVGVLGRSVQAGQASLGAPHALAFVIRQCGMPPIRYRWAQTSLWTLVLRLLPHSGNPSVFYVLMHLVPRVADEGRLKSLTECEASKSTGKSPLNSAQLDRLLMDYRAQLFVPLHYSAPYETVVGWMHGTVYDQIRRCIRWSRRRRAWCGGVSVPHT